GHWGESQRNNWCRHDISRESFGWMKTCLRPGLSEAILTYTYHGESESAVCFRSNYYSNFNVQFSKSPEGSSGGRHCEATYGRAAKCAWWAKVTLKSGRTGWVDMYHAKFGNVDRFG